jgi:hypothetical protein
MKERRTAMTKKPTTKKPTTKKRTPAVPITPFARWYTEGDIEIIQVPLSRPEDGVAEMYLDDFVRLVNDGVLSPFWCLDEQGHVHYRAPGSNTTLPVVAAILLSGLSGDPRGDTLLIRYLDGNPKNLRAANLQHLYSNQKDQCQPMQ